jgi:glycosyltransferase involved in cell wall biosynthesis
MESRVADMKLAVVTNILAPYRVPLFEALAKRTDEFTVLLMAKREENRQWDVGTVPFQVEVLPGFHIRPRHAEVSLHFNYGVIHALRRLNPDVVLSGGFGLANVAAFVYCRLFRKKYVGWGELTLQDGAHTSFLRRILRRWMIAKSHGCIASSTEARDAFLHYGARTVPIMTCLLPFDVRQFHETAGQFRQSSDCHALRRRYPGPILLSVGQLIPRKGWRDLFQVYEKLIQHRPDVSLMIVGDGPGRTELERGARTRGWANVHFLGYLQPDQLLKYFAAADLFVFHTLYDSYGLVLAEAMAAQLPVVASVRAAATRDLIDDGVTGFEFDPMDHDHAAVTILNALSLPADQRVAMGQAAYARVRHADIEPSADRMVRFLESLGTADPSSTHPFWQIFPQPKGEGHHD